MRISKRDRNLLIFLLVFALLAAYYFFIIIPQEEKIVELETELDLKEVAKSEMELKMASLNNLNKNIEELEAAMAASANDYFSALTQEEMLMLIGSFAEGLPMTFSGMTFMDLATEEMTQIQYHADVNFDGDYESLMQYMRNVRTFDKRILIKDLVVQTEEDSSLTGRIKLEFNGLPQVASYTVPMVQLVSDQFIARDVTQSPFLPYEGFVLVEETTEFVAETNYPEYEFDKEPIDYTEYRPKTQIQGFEEGNTFFVANNEDITGFVTRSKTKVAGGFSADMSFDFVTGREHSEANLVFDTTPVLINKQADYLGLWVYAYEASNHKIGAVIIDSKGKEFKVELAPQVDWTQWKEIETPMPVEITYPCMIQRIYVEGIGYDQKLTGKYLFDQLQVSYPVQ